MFKNLDLFGYSPIIYINRRMEYKSIAGGIKMILIFSLLIILVSIEISDYLNTNNPTELQKIEIFTENSAILNKSNYFFAYYLEYPKDELYGFENFDFSKYVKVGKIVHYGEFSDDNKIDRDISNISIVNCSNFNFDGIEISEKKKKKIIEKAMCVDLNNTELNVDDEKEFSTIIELVIYENLSYAEEYAAKNNISDLYNSILFQLLKSFKFYLTTYSQSVLNFPSKYNENPIKKTLTTEKKGFTTHTVDYIYMTIKGITYKKESDFLRNEKYKKNYTYYDTIKIQETSPYVNTYFYGNDFWRLLSFQFHLDISNSLQILEYPTIMEKFSGVGGLINIIVVFLNFIFSWIQKLSLIIVSLSFSFFRLIYSL